jgi:hypothetical protein
LARVLADITVAWSVTSEDVFEIAGEEMPVHGTVAAKAAPIRR